MTAEPLISIIVPTHNLENFISETLDSILEQEYENYEALVVDDRSTDHTRDIVMGYSNRDSRIKLLSNNLPQGAAGARNAGLAHAQGEWTTFLDGDDVWVNNTLKTQIDALTEYPDAKLITSDFFLLEPSGTKTRYTDIDADWKKHYQAANRSERPYCLPNPVRAFLEDKPTTQTGVLLIKSELFAQTGHFDNNLEIFEDQLLWIKLAHCVEELIYIPKPLLIKRQRDGSLTRRGIPGSVWATTALKKLLIAPEFKAYKPEITKQISKFTLTNTFYYRKTGQKAKAVRSAIDGIIFSPSSAQAWRNAIAALLLM